MASDLNDLLESPPTEWPGHWVLVEAATADLENLWIEFTEESETSNSSIHTNTSTRNIIPDLPDIPDLEGIPDLAAEPSVSMISENEIADELKADDLQIVSDLLTPKGNSSAKEIPDLPNIPTESSAPLSTKADKQAPIMDDLEAMMNAEPEAESQDSGEEAKASASDMLEGLSMDVGPVKLGKVVEDPIPQIPTPLDAPATDIKSKEFHIDDLKLDAPSEIPGLMSEDTLPPVPRASLEKKTPPPPPPARKTGNLSIPQSGSPSEPFLATAPVQIRREVDELTPTPPPMVPTPPVEDSAAIEKLAIPNPLLTEEAKQTSLDPAMKSDVESKSTGENESSKGNITKGDIPHEERLLLDQLPKTYHRSFLALKAGNSLRMVSWPRDLMSELASKDKDFSLNTPSPFRITLRTEKSYHGYLIQTAFMTQFFLGWNNNQYPETLTVVPVKSDQMIVGFVIALGNKDADKKTALQAVEKTASIIGEKWKKIGPQFSKAA